MLAFLTVMRRNEIMRRSLLSVLGEDVVKLARLDRGETTRSREDQRTRDLPLEYIDADRDWLRQYRSHDTWPDAPW